MAENFYDHKIPEVLSELDEDTLKMVIVALYTTFNIDPKILVELCYRLQKTKGKLW